MAAPENYLSQTKPTLLISYGRSGNSPESVGAVDVADEVCGKNLYHLFITCNHEGALSKAAEKRENAYAINLTPETHDQSFAMTSSFSNMMLATLLCFSLDNLDEVKAELEDVIKAAERMLANNWEFFKDAVGAYDFNRIVYLGANCLKGIAQESQLKILELTAGRVATMYDSPMGFRHGPKSLINEQTLVLVFGSIDPYTRQYDLDLVGEVAGDQIARQVVLLSDQAAGIEHVREVLVEASADSLDIYRAFPYIIYGQLISLLTSLKVQNRPDTPSPTGTVNRVVQGVIIHPFHKE